MTPQIRDFDPLWNYPYDVRLRPRPVPSTGVFDAPQIKVCINGEWASHVDGVLGRLLESDAWVGTDEEIDGAIQQVRQLLATLVQTSEVCDVPVLTNIRVEDCVIEAQYDGIDEWVTIGAIADCAPPAVVDIEETADGLEKTFDGENWTLIYAYYRADATRRAAAFLAQANDARVVLYNAAAAQKLALGIVGSINEMDTRESRFDVRFGAGAVNNRRFILDENGNIYFSNTYAPPSQTAFITIQPPSSSQYFFRIQGRTGALFPGFYQQHPVQNSAAPANTTPAMQIIGDATSAATWGRLLEIGARGELVHKEKREVWFQNNNSPQRQANIGYDETLEVESPGTSTNHRTRMIYRTYRNGTAIENLRLDSDSSGNPRIGVHGASGAIRATLTGELAGIQPLKDFFELMEDIGFIIDSTDLGDPPAGGDGEDGEDGASVELRVHEGWIQWRQDDDNPTWTNLIELEDLRGPQGNPGIPGADGTDGTDGTDGEDCDCEPVVVQPPTVPGQTEDQDACNTAGSLTFDVLKKAVEEIVEHVNNTQSWVDSVANIVLVLFTIAGGLGGALLALAIKAAETLFFAIANAGFSYDDIVEDDTFWAAVSCAIYCAIKPDRSVTEENLPRIVAAVRMADHTNTAALNALADYLRDLTAPVISNLTLMGVYTQYNCSSCDCEDQVICDIPDIDFLTDDGDFTAAGACITWSAGVGWSRPATGCTENHISRVIEATVDYFEVEWHFSGRTLLGGLRAWDENDDEIIIGAGDVEVIDPEISGETRRRYHIDCEYVSRIEIPLTSSGTSSPPGQPHRVTKFKIECC